MNVEPEPPQLFPAHSLTIIEPPFTFYRNLINYSRYSQYKSIVWLHSGAHGTTIASAIHKERA